MKDKESERLKDEDINFMEHLKAFTSIRIIAPEGFTEAVMTSIYNLKKVDPDTFNIRVYFSRLYKNLGVSIVFASLIMILSLFIPKLNFYQSFISNDLQSGSTEQQTYKMKENLTGMSININSIFNSINKSVTRFKEGT